MKGEYLVDFLEGDFHLPESLLGTWLRESSLNLVWAITGLCKSHFCMGIAWAVASGGPFLRWTCPRPRKVGLADGEMGRIEVKNRLETLATSQPEQPANEFLKVLTLDHFGTLGMPNLSTPEGQRVYDAEFADRDLIIIDNLITCSFPTDKWDDDVKQWDRIQKWALGHRRNGKALIFVHHAGKSGDQLGTSKRTAIMNTVISLRKARGSQNGLAAEMHFDKTRSYLGDDAEALYLTYTTTEVGSFWDWSTLQDHKASEVELRRNMKMKDAEIARELGMSLFEIRRLSQKVNHYAGAKEIALPEGDEDF